MIHAGQSDRYICRSATGDGQDAWARRNGEVWRYGSVRYHPHCTTQIRDKYLPHSTVIGHGEWVCAHFDDCSHSIGHVRNHAHRTIIGIRDKDILYPTIIPYTVGT